MDALSLYKYPHTHILVHTPRSDKIVWLNARVCASNTVGPGAAGCAFTAWGAQGQGVQVLTDCYRRARAGELIWAGCWGQPRWPSSRSGCRHPPAPSFRGINGAQAAITAQILSLIAACAQAPPLHPLAHHALARSIEPLMPSLLDHLSPVSSGPWRPVPCARARMHGLHDATLVMSPTRAQLIELPRCLRWYAGGLTGCPGPQLLAAAAGVQTGEESSSTGLLGISLRHRCGHAACMASRPSIILRPTS
jgi:hypothetical protein